MDDNGFFDARIKLASTRKSPNALTEPGDEKSSMTWL